MLDIDSASFSRNDNDSKAAIFLSSLCLSSISCTASCHDDRAVRSDRRLALCWLRRASATAADNGGGDLRLLLLLVVFESFIFLGSFLFAILCDDSFVLWYQYENSLDLCWLDGFRSGCPKSRM